MSVTAIEWLAAPIAIRAESANATYVCSACNVQQANAGPCPQCNQPLKKCNVTYECASCGVAQIRPGTCSMCGTELKEKK